MIPISALKSRDTLGATLLVTGCCIGAAMLGLPVLSVFAGFMPSALAMLLCYLFTTATGLLLLESTLWFEEKVNLPTIAEFALGKMGKVLALLLFLFLFYCIFVAYLDGGGVLFCNLLSYLFDRPIPREVGIITCVLLVSGLTYAGTRIVDNLNRGLILGLIVTYCLLVFLALPQVQSANLQHTDWKAALATVPILMICFGYQNLVPSLATYLKRNVKALRFAIIVGNMIPLFIYLLWNFVILGIMPFDQALPASETEMITGLLQSGNEYMSVLFIMNAFSMFAILTSFLPSALSFVDFLRDGLNCSPQGGAKQNLLLCCAVFVPPLLCALYYPKMFLQALGFAGGFIDVLLFGILPAVIVLVGRYYRKASGPYQVMGGVMTPVAIILCSMTILYLKTMS